MIIRHFGTSNCWSVFFRRDGSEFNKSEQSSAASSSDAQHEITSEAKSKGYVETKFRVHCRVATNFNEHGCFLYSMSPRLDVAYECQLFSSCVRVTEMSGITTRLTGFRLHKTNRSHNSIYLSLRAPMSIQTISLFQFQHYRRLAPPRRSRQF